jgi:hypothetical protein
MTEFFRGGKKSRRTSVPHPEGSKLFDRKSFPEQDGFYGGALYSSIYREDSFSNRWGPFAIRCPSNRFA